MSKLVITNNPLIKEQLSNKVRVDYRDAGAAEILSAVSAEVENGARLMGDPNRELKNYYQSVLLFTETTEVSDASLKMINDAMKGIKNVVAKKPSFDGAARKKDLNNILQKLR